MSIPFSSTTRCAVPALLLVAAAAGAGEAELRLSPIVYVQTRAELPTGTAANGTDTTPSTEGTLESDTIDFYLRRARVGARFTFGNWTGRILLESDNAQRNGDNTKNGSLTTTGNPVTAATFANGSRDNGLYDAYGIYTLKGEELSHEFRAGLYTAVFNPSSYFSSGNHMFAASAATENLLDNRNVGVGYSLKHSQFDLSLDVMNSRTDGTAGQNAGAGVSPDGDGLWISTRLQYSGHEGWGIGRWQESYAGAEGRGYAVALELARDENRNATSTVTTTQFGLDGLFHLDELTALAEFRVQIAETENDNGSESTQRSLVWRLQAGYAFLIEDMGAIEPCARVQFIDLNTGNDKETGAYGTGRDFATTSGTEINLGVNWYISGHRNKVSLLYTMWDAEEGSGDANIIRFQHQLSF